MSQRISVEVVEYGIDGPLRAGMAIVSLNGRVIAKLRTTEGIEFTIAEPEISTQKIKREETT